VVRSGSQVRLSSTYCHFVSWLEFQEAVCIAMRMKYHKSHVTVREVVKNMKENTKEKLSEDFLARKKFSVIVDK
jgi:hypothetical protein